MFGDNNLGWVEKQQLDPEREWRTRPDPLAQVWDSELAKADE
ncbi:MULTISPECIES: hypothetical protein [Cyanophyceae]|nr:MULTISPECIES: hypothetical protein [Cyanophyceae]